MLTYSVSYYKNKKWVKIGTWFIVLIVPALMIGVLLLIVHSNKNGEYVDKILSKYIPITIGFYIGLLIVYIIIAVRVYLYPASDKIVIENNQIIIKDISLFIPKCTITYGKVSAGVKAGTTEAMGTICYINDGVKTIKVCIYKLLYDDESKYTQPWYMGTNYYLMEKKTFDKFIDDVKQNFAIKEIENKNDTPASKNSVTVELMKYPQFLPYLLTSILFIFLFIAICLWIDLDEPPFLWLPSPIIVAVLLVRYKRRKIKNYLVEINNNMFCLKERRLNREIITIPIHNISLKIFAYRPYGIGLFWKDYWNTRLQIIIPSFGKLKIDTRNIQKRLNTRMNFWDRNFGNLYVFFNSYDYIIDNASWKRLAHALVPTSTIAKS